MEPAEAPTKACHNCRRQRLRCDRSYPHCHKCVVAGKECLGYGKLFRWTGAIATRGRLAGCTSVDGTQAASSALTLMSAPTPTPSSPASPVRASSAQTASPSPAPGGWYKSPAEGEPTNVYDDEDVQLISRTPTPDWVLRNPWVLTDPVYQDLNGSHRYYLSYFTNRLCQDLVAHDVADGNPFRSLLPLTRTHPLLQYVIVASSAAHMSNLIKAPLRGRNHDQTMVSSIQQASASALRDALIAKQTALRLMHIALQNIDTIGGDVILAAALFFVNVELIESGKSGWRPHLEGAGRIMAMLPDSEKVGDMALRNYMLSDCFIYFILASIFMPTKLSMTGSPFQASQIPLILEKAAANSYLCCPPEILAILYSASEISNFPPEIMSPEESAQAGSALIRRAQAFNIDAWANNARNVPYLRDTPIQSRVHAGSAHRLAACLYTLKAIPSMSTLESYDGVAEALREEIFEHLSCVPDDDPNFKATSWPTFIAGAETSSEERQQWVMDRLQRLSVCCPWGFLYTAMDTLPVIWELDLGQRSWVQTLKDPEMNFLIV